MHRLNMFQLNCQSILGQISLLEGGICSGYTMTCPRIGNVSSYVLEIRDVHEVLENLEMTIFEEVTEDERSVVSKINILENLTPIVSDGAMAGPFADGRLISA